MVERQENDRLTFRNHKGEEKTISRQEFRNAARYASDNYSHNPERSNRPENNTPKDRQFNLTHINGKSI